MCGEEVTAQTPLLRRRAREGAPISAVPAIAALCSRTAVLFCNAAPFEHVAAAFVVGARVHGDYEIAVAQLGMGRGDRDSPRNDDLIGRRRRALG